MRKRQNFKNNDNSELKLAFFITNNTQGYIDKTTSPKVFSYIKLVSFGNHSNDYKKFWTDYKTTILYILKILQRTDLYFSSWESINRTATSYR